jgi:hypothetical protein
MLLEWLQWLDAEVKGWAGVVGGIFLGGSQMLTLAGV